ncbi:MAG: hypothetical protein HQ567_16660 [Candidatus Nealsonbacteria bacterium]|nr:hypothetical protein [Candidatus Nealsonbacteria bacterium]
MRRLSIGVSLAAFLTVTFGCVAAYAQTSSAESNVVKRVVGGKTVQSERDEQQSLYNYYFRKQNLQYKTKLADLKTEASVAPWRIPYSAAIHSEASGGLSSGGGARPGRRGGGGGGTSALSVYDRAFNGGDSANSYEVRRIMGQDRAVFPRLRMRINSESWEGYCSGFTASTIRHPEPITPVDAGRVGGTPGVVFQSADIKALLTGIYNRTTDDSYLYLAPPSARDGGPNMGTFHLALANYIGQAGCPVGIDRTKGETSWNNPIYSYKVKSISDAGSKGDLQYKNVTATITYTSYGSDTSRQTDPSTGARVGNAKQSMNLRYVLAIDADGNIVGGRAISSGGNFLWLPLFAVQGREDGAVPGNPYIDVRKVIALARASAMPDVQKKFDKIVIGPAIDPALTEDQDETE